MLISLLFYTTRPLLLGASSIPQDTVQTTHSREGFIVKDRWPGVRGDADVGACALWKDQPRGLQTASCTDPVFVPV